MTRSALAQSGSGDVAERSVMLSDRLRF